MKSDISIYENAKRNEKCPCGSGIIFKKCCMDEYRKTMKSLSSAKLSPYSPLKPLSQFEKDEFTKLYQELLFFSNQYQNDSNSIYIKDKKELVNSFLSRQRTYFYENADEVIDQYIEQKNPTEEQLMILDALRSAKFDTFYLLSKCAESAVLMDTDEKLYNIQALHSPFDELFNFPLKYLVFATSLIAYKNCYITDGLYGGLPEMPKEVENYLDKIPFKNPMIHYNRNNRVLNIPLVLNFSLSCNIDQFKKMEDIVLKKIPQAFSQGLIELFDDSYSYRKNIISSMIRSTDLSHELNNEEGDQAFNYIIGAAPATSFEHGNTTDVIPYEILKKYYVQKPIEKSFGSASYNKAKNKDFMARLMSDYSSYYTMLGIVHIEEDKIDDFVDYLEGFNSKEKREELTVGLENLFEELSKEYGFEISPVFLGVGTDLDSIHEEIELYRDYMISEQITNLDDCKKYSIYKGNLQ